MSSTQPHSFSMMTASSIRIGWVIAICTPAIRLLSKGLGKADDQAGGAGGGEQADAVLLDGFEGHQRRRDGNDDDQGIDHALEDTDLGDMLAGEKVLVGIEAEALQIA